MGDVQDLAVAYVGWLARHNGVNVLELREEGFGTDWTFAFEDLQIAEGAIKAHGQTYRFTELSGVYVRLHPEPGLPNGLELSGDGRAVFLVERRAAIEQFLNSLPCTVVNRPLYGRSNGSKPYQMSQLSQMGFNVPKWVLTNNKRTATEFASECPDGVVYKSCSGLRSQVRLLDENLLKRLNEGTSPILLQEYIVGREVRMHVVGRRCFPTEVISTGIDYRFHERPGEFRETKAPTRVSDLCREATEREGLVISGIDFRVTADGDWYCLEMNPVPSFLPYEMATKQPICRALLDALVHDRPISRGSYRKHGFFADPLAGGLQT